MPCSGPTSSHPLLRVQLAPRPALSLTPVACSHCLFESCHGFLSIRITLKGSMPYRSRSFAPPAGKGTRSRAFAFCKLVRCLAACSSFVPTSGVLPSRCSFRLHFPPEGEARTLACVSENAGPRVFETWAQGGHASYAVRQCEHYLVCLDGTCGECMDEWVWYAYTL